MERTMLSQQTGGALARVLLVILGLAVCAAPAGAITWGQKDTTGQYPNVGTILASVPSESAVYQWCSGALVHPKVFLTAGHCTVNLPGYLASGLIDKLYVSFDYDPFAHPEGWLEVDSVITNPDFAFKPRSNWHDNGALVLKVAASDITPAELPEEGFLDRLQAEGALGHGTHGAGFTVVGYGATLSFPPPRTFNENVRQFAQSEFRALLPAWLRLSQQGKNGNGGTCYGDSGGPTFWQEPGGDLILVATTTWGDVPCVTSEFNQRIDLASSLSFIQGVIDNLPAGLSAPTQLSPPDGSVFDYFPRLTTFQWSSVPGAVGYELELDCFHCCVWNQWCSDVGETYKVQLTETSYIFEWWGAQPGRWRVRAIDADGNAGPYSGWWGFTYLQ